MKKLIIILNLAFMPAWGSLVQILGLDPNIIYSPHITKDRCKQFKIIDAAHQCNKIVQSWKKLQKKETPRRRELLKQKQHLFMEKINQLSKIKIDHLRDELCLTCNELGVIDPFNQNNIELFQNFFSCDIADDAKTDLFCDCVRNRTKIAKITPPSINSTDKYQKLWGQKVGKMVSGMIYSTIAEIGDAIAEVSITGKSYDHSKLPSCDITQMRKTIDQLQSKGCASGIDVNHRLSLIFPEQSIDQVLEGYEHKAVELIDPGIPPLPDPPEECKLPKQYLAVYRKADQSKMSRCILQATKILQKVIPESVILDIYRKGGSDPFNQVLEYAHNSSLPLPDEISSSDWLNTKILLSTAGNSIIGGKLFYNFQSWEGVRSVYAESSDIEAIPNYDDCEKPDEDLSAILQGESFKREYEKNLERKCDDVFGKLLEKAICSPLGSPVSHHQLDLGEATQGDFLSNEQLYCQNEHNEALDIMGSKSYLFARDEPLNDTLDFLYFREDEYQKFNALCPLLKECEPNVSYCTVRSFASITDEEYAKLSEQEKKTVDQYRVAEEMISTHIDRTRPKRSRTSKEMEEAPEDDLFEGLGEIAHEPKSADKIDINKTIQEEKEKVDEVRIPHFMQTKEEQIAQAEKEIKSREERARISEKKETEIEADYGNEFVNQLICGAKPIALLTAQKDPVIPYRNKDPDPVVNNSDSATEDKKEKQTAMLQNKIKELKTTMNRLDESDKTSRKFSQIRRDYQRSEYKYEHEAMEAERASIERERGLIRDATVQQREQNESMRKQLDNDSKIKALQAGLEQTQASHQRREEQQQGQIDQLSNALRSQADISRQKDKETRALQSQIQNMMDKVASSRDPKNNKQPRSNSSRTRPQRASTSNGSSRDTKPSSSAVASAGSRSGVNSSFTPSNRAPASTQQPIPTIESKDYISLNREKNILEHGVSNKAPNFNLKTYNIHGDQIEIPMRAEFDSKGQISKLTPDLRPEHYSLINSIRDRAIRENLIGLVERNSGVQIVSEVNYLELNENQLITSLGASQAFNILVKAKDGTHMVIPFQVMRRGESTQNVRIHLDYQNYPWMKDSLARIENSRVLEKIYLQMEIEDKE